MNYKKSKKLLKKISKIIDVLSENDEQPSTIENDLLRSYTRELYESINEETVDRKAFETNEVKVEAPYIQENVIERPPVNKIKVVAIAEEAQQEMPQPQSADAETDSVIEELFSAKEGSDLSDRLSMRPLSDIGMGMGINEKIFTIQELFGGNKKGFDETISTLNGFSSFEEASVYLKQGVAKSNDWADGGKIKKAENFIKLVRRRYR